MLSGYLTYCIKDLGDNRAMNDYDWTISHDLKRNIQHCYLVSDVLNTVIPLLSHVTVMVFFV